jgi:hypothetical protein
MNLVTCSSPCIHQKDGYCSLQTLERSVTLPMDSCVYFSSQSDPPPQTSDENPAKVGDGTDINWL